MTSRGFPKPYSAALTLITSTLATLVPPSILMIVAASASASPSVVLCRGYRTGAYCWGWPSVATTSSFGQKRVWQPTSGLLSGKSARPYDFPSLHRCADHHSDRHVFRLRHTNRSRRPCRALHRCHRICGSSGAVPSRIWSMRPSRRDALPARCC